MDWAGIGQFIQDVGIPSALAVLLVVILLNLIKTNAEERKRAAALQDNLLQYMLKQDQQIELLRQTIQITSDKKEAAIEQNIQAVQANRELIELNTKALTEDRAQWLKLWSEAVDKMGAARGDIVQQVNEHTALMVTPVGEAITAARTENQAQHSNQSEVIRQNMDNLENAIKANGLDRKAQYDDIQSQLKTMTETLQALQQDMTTLNAQAEQSKAQQAAIAAIGQKVDLLATAFDHLKQELTPPPPPAFPPPDETKSEEMK